MTLILNLDPLHILSARIIGVCFHSQYAGDRTPGSALYFGPLVYFILRYTPL